MHSHPMKPNRMHHRMRDLTRGAWRALGVTSLVAVAALTLAACTDDDGGEDDGDTTEATPTEAMTETATPTEEMTETATPTEEMTATEEATEEATEAAGGDTTISVATEGELAPYLVGPDGMTLYLFTNDEDGVTNCFDSCIQNWPPLTVPEGEEPTASEDAPGELGVIEREDGLGRHVTYDGMPLYYWQGDSAPGDTTGEGVGDVWYVVPPGGDDSAASTSSGSSAAGDY